MLTALATLLTAVAVPAHADRSADPVTRWPERHGDPIRSVDPDPSTRDLRSLGRAVGDADVVGLGEAAHKLTEVTALKHRAVRYLVTEHGFRSIAWEDDWSLCTQLNDYILGGRDDRDALVGQMSRAFRRSWSSTPPFTVPNFFAYRDARAGENLRWWNRYSGDKILYWAASAHTANVDELRITNPPNPDATFASVGSYLHDW